MENIKLLYIDLFCEAGGISTSVEHVRLDGTIARYFKRRLP